MGRRKRGRAWCIVLILSVCLSRGSAEGDRLVVTVDQPGIISAVEAPAAEPRPAGQSTRVILSVIAYRPPEDGAVEAIVKVINSKREAVQEIGRFGIHPDVEFRVDDRSKAPRYAFLLPKELTGHKPIKLQVEIVPLTGEGKSARLEIGGAEIL